MDLQVALVSVGLCVLSAVVVYLISVFGMREQTYEEAIEEQRKRNQEALLSGSNKSDKPKKEKKYKKAGSGANKKNNKESNSGKNSHSEDSEGNKNESVPSKVEKTDHHGERVDFKVEAEIIPLDATPELNIAKTAKNSKKKSKSLPAPKSILVNKQEQTLLNANAKLSTNAGDDDDVEDTPSDLPIPTFVPKDEVERRHSMDLVSKKPIQLLGSVPVADSSPKPMETKKKEEKKEPEADSIATNPQPTVTKLEKTEPVVNTSPNKKNKKGKADENSAAISTETEISGKKLLQLVKVSPLQDDEIHLLIEVLLNKQQHESSAEWTKKNDPVAALKKQLQEREQALENEQRQYQAVNAKLREVRLELSQEKTSRSQSERVLKEKLAQQIQETQSLHARLQHAHDQHLAESGALQNKYQQLQAKVNDEQSVALQHLSEENGKLQQKLSRLEAERQSLSNSEKQLQLQMKQLQSACEHYETAQVANQQKIDTYENHLKQLQTSKQEDEYKFAQTISELSQKVADSDNCLGSVTKDLQHAKAVASSAEADRLNLVSRLEQVESTSRKLEEEGALLKQALENEKSTAHDVRLRLEHTQSQAKSAATQQTEANKIAATLREENEQLKAQLAQISVRTAAEGQESNTLNQQNGEVQTSEKEIQDLTKVLAEKESQLSKVSEELRKNLSSISGLQQELEEQKKKNNELREKNWKAMEALNDAEKAKSAALAKGQSVEDLERRLKEAQGNLQEALKTKDDLCVKLQNEQVKDREILHRLLPEFKTDKKMEHSIWVENFVNEVSRKLSATATLPPSPPTTPSDTSEKVINGETGGVDSKLIHLKAENSSLQAQINHYKTVLAETENILKELESGVEAEEVKWREKLEEKERQLTKALEEKAKLEKNLEELQEATAEMQSKLKELQAKLQEEENEKKSLELKSDEVNKITDDIRQQLEAKMKELDSLAEERKALKESQDKLQVLHSQLEEERKKSKDLSSQTVKLNSLVKIGQDALRAEQELVKELQAELMQQKSNGSSVLVSEAPVSPKPTNGQHNISITEADSSCVSSAAPSSTSSTTSSTTPISSNPVKSEKSSKHKKRKINLPNHFYDFFNKRKLAGQNQQGASGKK